ncbi:hypothetical protein V5O48_002676 [Marasmius crinis-equi]|uniref:Cytochrome P450 n=1 Tax=Marasmius crinis-equi TaxID=585013 RepID=A0ABR3FV19_9AGAR
MSLSRVVGGMDVLPRSFLGLPNLYRYYLPAAVVLWWLVSRRERRKLPPSPGRALPIIGHLHLFPRDNAWLKFTEWSRQLGPVFHLNLAGQDVVVLGTHKAAADLLDRRSSIYSDRARNYVAGELMAGGMVFGFTDAHETWKKMRRASHEAMNPSMALRYRPMQELESYILCHQLLQKPDIWDDHIRRANLSLMFSIIYGLPPKLDSEDPNIRRTNAFVSGLLAAASPGAYLVEYFTWLKYLPRWMCGWRRHAEAFFQSYCNYFESMFADVETRMIQGTQGTCVATTYIENRFKLGLTDREAACAAGGETTAGQMAWLVLAIVLYPDIQKKTQQQIDTVVGRDRMPNLQDIPNLPYVSAFVTEVMRWRGVGPLSVPHRANTDDYYQGFYIPKDTVVIPNVWALNHDPNVWGPDPDDFRPERHLDETGQLKKPLPDTHEESHVTFGFGRRVCVGKYVANNSLLIQAACLLWSFSFSPNKDKSGKPVFPDTFAWEDSGLVVRPEEFSCVIRPRAPEIETVIRQSLDAKGFSL